MPAPPTADRTPDLTPRQDTVLVRLVADAPPHPPLPALLAVLDPEERARAAALRSAVDRRRYVLAHAALRHVLADRLGVEPAGLRWRRGPHGKPALDDPHAATQVNLSHSDALALIAVSGARPVGVDVQRVLPGTDAVAMAERYFPPEEARLVRAVADPARRAACFARLWARKEALVKAYGGRLVPGLRIAVHATDTPAGPHPVRLADLPAPPGYRAAVALLGPAPFRTALHPWTWPDPLSPALP